MRDKHDGHSSTKGAATGYQGGASERISESGGKTPGPSNAVLVSARATGPDRRRR